MMKILIKTILLGASLLALSACGSLEVSKTGVNKILVNNMSKEWNGSLLSPGKESPVLYSISINNISTKLIPNGEYHDVELTLNGKFIIKTEPFLADTPIEVIIASHASINEENTSLNLTDSFAKKIIFPDLYQSYSQDLLVPVQESISNISNSKLEDIDIISFSKEMDEVAQYAAEKNIGKYSIIKNNDGSKIEIQFKTFKGE